MIKRNLNEHRQVIILAIFFVSFFLWFIMILLPTSNMLTRFSWDGFVSTCDKGDFIFALQAFAFFVLVVFFCGVMERNLGVNLLMFLFEAPGIKWYYHNFATFQPYISTTYEGKIFLAEMLCHILILLFSLVGLYRWFRKWRKSRVRDEYSPEK